MPLLPIGLLIRALRLRAAKDLILFNPKGAMQICYSAVPHLNEYPHAIDLLDVAMLSRG
jgi:hypothetical protein